MSAIRLPVTRPAGRVLLVGSESCRATPLELLRKSGFACGESDSPYSAILELSRQVNHYGALLLCLNSIYKEELPMIAAVKRRWPNLDIWLAQTENRQSTLEEAIAFGADGVIDQDGFHRTANLPSRSPSTFADRSDSLAQNLAIRPASPLAESDNHRNKTSPSTTKPTSQKTRRQSPDSGQNVKPAKLQGISQINDPPMGEAGNGEAILTADELRALLADPPPAAEKRE